MAHVKNESFSTVKAEIGGRDLTTHKMLNRDLCEVTNETELRHTGQEKDESEDQTAEKATMVDTIEASEVSEA
jgi:hypothetical protein